MKARGLFCIKRGSRAMEIYINKQTKNALHILQISSKATNNNALIYYVAKYCCLIFPSKGSNSKTLGTYRNNQKKRKAFESIKRFKIEGNI